MIELYQAFCMLGVTMFFLGVSFVVEALFKSYRKIKRRR